MKAYIQLAKNNHQNINNQNALFGFERKGYEIERFDYDDLESLNLNRDEIVVGGIKTVKKALNILDCHPKFVERDYPESLKEYLGRKVWTSTLSEARESENPIFIKPTKGDQKLFNGFVFNNFRDLIDSSGIDPNLKVECSEIVNFVSEYRVFVADGEVLGIINYKGNFRVFPDFSVIDSAISSYIDAPAGYGIDFGVTDCGKTLLVECNDGFSLGGYGLNPALYSYLLETRWKELSL